MQIQHGNFIIPIGISDFDSEQESIQLRLRKSIHPLLFDRILGCKHHEGKGQRQRRAVNRNLTFLHRFQQRGLCPSRSSIQFIGEQKLTKYRAFPQNEMTRIAIKNLYSRNVRREKVRRKLDTLELDS